MSRDGQAKSITDPAGNIWTYSYDVHGRLTSSTDPDRGTTSTTYDAADQVTTSTDGRGQVLWQGYDSLGRQTQLRQNNSTGTQLAAWTYDTATLGKGLPASSTRYNAGNADTTTVAGYTPTGQPTGSSITIPAAEGTLAGTHSTAVTYTPSGTPLQYTPATAPGLPTDTQINIYDELDQQIGVDTSDNGVIVPGVTIDAYGRSTQAEGYVPLAPVPLVAGVGPSAAAVQAGDSGAFELGAGVGAGHDVTAGGSYGFELFRGW